MSKTYICPCCGKSYICRHTSDSYIGDNCFDCSFWLGKTEASEDRASHQVIINGEYFMLGESAGPFQGFGGQKFKIQFFDGRIVETNNLWGQGPIPERFKPMLLDNAVFLPVEPESAPGGAYV